MNIIRLIEDYFKRRQLIAAVVSNPRNNIIEVTYNGHTLILIRNNVSMDELYNELNRFVEVNRD